MRTTISPSIQIWQPCHGRLGMRVSLLDTNDPSSVSCLASEYLLLSACLRLLVILYAHHPNAIAMCTVLSYVLRTVVIRPTLGMCSPFVMIEYRRECVMKLTHSIRFSHTLSRLFTFVCLYQSVCSTPLAYHYFSFQILTKVCSQNVFHLSFSLSRILCRMGFLGSEIWAHYFEHC